MLQQESITITLDDQPCVVADAARFPTVARRANSYWCPLGPAVGRAWVLMLRRDLNQIESDDKKYHELVFETERAGGQSGKVSISKLLLVKTERLSPGGADSDESLHVVELADKRLLLDRFSDVGNIQVNVRSYAQSDNYLSGTSGYTWSSAVEEIWDTMSDVLGEFPGLPDDYSPNGIPENLRLTGVNAWRALSVVLRKIGCTVAYHPLDDTFQIVLLGSQQSDLPDSVTSDEGDHLLDAESLEENAAKYPENIRVYFHNHYRSYGQERDTEKTNNFSVNGAVDYIDVPTGMSGVVTGTVVSLWDDLPRVLDENNNLANSSDLNSRAQQRADNWVNDQKTSGRRMHRVLPGIVDDIVPGSEIKAVLWRAWGPSGGGTATEIVCHPGLPEQITDPMSLPIAAVSDTQIYGGESAAPPDLARHSYPNYPRLPNVVRVWHSGQSAGYTVTANAGGLHPGQVCRWVAGSMATLENCWVLFVDDFDSAAGNVSAVNGDYFGPARLCGIETSQGSTLPIYLVRHGDNVATALLQQTVYALHAYNSQDQTLNTAADETLKIDTKYIDQGGIWNLSAGGQTEGELTVNATGLFRVNLTIDIGFEGQGPGQTDTALGGKAWIEKSPSSYTWGRVVNSLVKANVWYYFSGDGCGWHATGSRTILISATQGDKYRVQIERGGEGHTVSFYAPIISTPPGYAGTEIGCSWVWTPVWCPGIIA